MPAAAARDGVVWATRTLLGPVRAGHRLAATATRLTGVRTALELVAELAVPELQREIAHVRERVAEEARYHRENPPPLLNPVPFPL